MSNVTAWWVQSTLVAMAGLSLPRLFRATGSRVYLPYLQILLVAMLVLPTLLPRAAQHVPETPADTALYISMSRPLSALTARAANTSAVDLIPWVIAAGVAARLTWLAVGLVRLDWYRRRSMRLADLPLALRHAVTDVGAHAEFRYANPLAGPVSFGFFQPVILLPFGFLEMRADAQRAVAVHELLHVRRNDWLTGFAEELVAAFFWFVPGVWLVVSEIRLAREKTVDRTAVSLFCDRAGYARTLLAMSADSPAPNCALTRPFLSKRHLFARMEALVKENTMPARRSALIYPLIITAVAGTALAVAQVAPLQRPPESRATVPSLTVTPTGAITHHAAAEYPEEARLANVQGTVIVEVFTDTAGLVTGARALSGPDILKAAAERSALKLLLQKTRPEAGRLAIEFHLPELPELAMGQQITGIKVQGLSAPDSATAEARLQSFVGQVMTAAVWNEIRQVAVGHIDIEFNGGKGRLYLSAPPRPGNGRLVAVHVAASLAEPARSEMTGRLDRYVGREIDANLLQDMHREVRSIDPDLTVWFQENQAVVRSARRAGGPF